MNILLSKPSQTIKEIKKQLEIPLYIKRRLPLRIDTLIRWGSLREADCVDEINSVKAIKLSSDKLKCRKVLAEAGIPVPHLGEDRFPCIGRFRYHSGGKNFFVCQTPYDVERAKRNGAVYFQQVYPKGKEYRVHIGKNSNGEFKVILYSEKVGDKMGGIIWNHDIGGFEFIHLGRGERRLDIIELAKKTIETLGLDFGAVDIGSNPIYPDYPKCVVFEVNTAPALEGYSIQKYVQYFEELLDDSL